MKLNKLALSVMTLGVVTFFPTASIGGEVAKGAPPDGSGTTAPVAPLK